MALQKSIPDPTGTTNIASAYFRIVEVNTNFADQIGRVTLNCYRSKGSRDAGKPPVTQVIFTLTKDGVAEVKDGDGNVVTPAFPGFNELVSELVDAYNAIKTKLYTVVKTQPDFADSEDV
jgi:hypothetical protein